MNETKRTVYKMNPAEDCVLYGDELTEGMWVMPQSLDMRNRAWPDEDEFLRGQRFCRVTKLRQTPADGIVPAGIAFVGEWVDGYQFAYRMAHAHAWIVKRENPAEAESTGEPR